MALIRIRHHNKVTSHMTLPEVQRKLGLPPDLVELAIRQGVIGTTKRHKPQIHVAFDDVLELKRRLIGTGSLPDGEPVRLPTGEHRLKVAPDRPPGCVLRREVLARWGARKRMLEHAVERGAVRTVAYRGQQFCFESDLNRLFGTPQEDKHVQ